jgi:hypothetical protein
MRESINAPREGRVLMWQLKSGPIVALVLWAGLAVSQVSADLLVPDGTGPQTADSWYQTFVDNIAAPGADRFAVTSITGAGFENPAFRMVVTDSPVLSAVGTSLTLTSPVTRLGFDLYFNGDISSVSFDFAAFKGTTRVEFAHVFWDNTETKWTVDMVEGNSVNPAVPLPSTAFASIGSLGAIALFGALRRRRSAAA